MFYEIKPSQDYTKYDNSLSTNVVSHKINDMCANNSPYNTKYKKIIYFLRETYHTRRKNFVLVPRFTNNNKNTSIISSLPLLFFIKIKTNTT